ncbi:MAG TPA: GNAT family N-acetyltransferase [Thermohalobaculum sp.]|nr:GNAT family N-acetyltransferase [Thermohalobaculum sp.]
MVFSWLRGRKSARRDSGRSSRDPRDPIETRRLLLRPFRDGDATAFYRLNSDPEVMRYMPAPLTREESDDLLERLIERSQAGDITFRAVVLKAGHFLGIAGLNRPRFEAPFMPCIEVGWRLMAAAWGRGYATEAARAAVAHGFENLGLREIVAFAPPANERSIAVMERLGMHRDPANDFEHPRFPEGHPLRPHVLYRITRAEWDEAREPE